MSAEEQIIALNDRLTRLEATVVSLLNQLSAAEANNRPSPLAASHVTQPTLTLLIENGRPLNGAHITDEIRIGSSLTQATHWELDGEDLGTFEFGWYNLELDEGDHVMKISSLDGHLSSMVEFTVVPK